MNPSAILTELNAAQLEVVLHTEWPPLSLGDHIAVRKGCDPDEPRNLAKSVTVE